MTRRNVPSGTFTAYIHLSTQKEMSAAADEATLFNNQLYVFYLSISLSDRLLSKNKRFILGRTIAGFSFLRNFLTQPGICMTTQPPKERIISIDILRGAIMLIMAIDHVRDFFHIHGADQSATNLATTTPFLFFTRWITHFCAPVFLFLSGTSAFIAGQKRTVHEKTMFLLKRGLWLLFVEVVIMTLGITFNPFYNFIIFQVIWAIGWSMIVLALLLRTSISVIFITGCLLFFGRNILDYISLPAEGPVHVFLNIVVNSPTTLIPLGHNRFIFDLYAILPWTGVMLLGYSLGTLYRPTVQQSKRAKVLTMTGISLIAFFIVIRFINQYGDPAPWSYQKNWLFTVISFLNTTKYPASLQYLSMTLGPALVLLPLLENAHSKFSRLLMVYGKVPFFYYVIHFYLIHTLGVIFFFACGYGKKDIVEPSLPFLFRPLHFGFNLWIVYGIWLFVVVILYKPCKWFINYKSTHKQWWLQYL